MKFTTFTFTLFILIGTISCSNKRNSSQIVEENAHLHHQEISILQDDLFLFSSITSFDFISDDLFVVTTNKPSDVIIFQSSGEQVKKIGKSGRGPFEYQNPSLVRVHNNKIFVWDAAQLKLIIYNREGEPIKEFTEFQVAIKDFVVSRNLVSFYFGGGFSGLVGVYDLTKGQFLYRGGEASQEHIMLNLNSGAGGISLSRNGLAFISADQLKLDYINFENFKPTNLMTLNDPEFNVESIQHSTDIINTNFKKAMAYIMENSYVTGLFSSGDNMIIKAEVGKFERNNNINDSSKRFRKYYVLDKNFKLIKTAKAAYNFNENNNLFTAYNGNLYCLKFKSIDDFRYQLNKISFEDISPSRSPEPFAGLSF